MLGTNLNLITFWCNSVINFLRLLAVLLNITFMLTVILNFLKLFRRLLYHESAVFSLFCAVMIVFEMLPTKVDVPFEIHYSLIIISMNLSFSDQLFYNLPHVIIFQGGCYSFFIIYLSVNVKRFFMFSCLDFYIKFHKLLLGELSL